MDPGIAQLTALLVNTALAAEEIRASSAVDEIKEKAKVVTLGLLRQAEALVGSRED